MGRDEEDLEFIKSDGEIEVYHPKSLTKSELDVKRKDMPKYLTKQQINDVLARMKPGRDKIICIVLWMTGVRVTELINMRKEDLDVSNKTVTIRWQKNKKWKNRNLPVHPHLSSMLEFYTTGLNQEDKLFDVSRQRVYQITKKYFNISPHQFRHSFAVHFLQETKDLITLHKLLGHDRINTTMEYLKIVPIDQAKVLDKVSFI